MELTKTRLNSTSISFRKLFLIILILRVFASFDVYFFFLDFSELQIVRLLVWGLLLIIAVPKLRLNPVGFFALFSVLVLINSIHQSNINFSQPLIKGFIGEHTRLFAFSGVYIYWLLYTKRITINQLTRLVIRTAWVTFVLYLILYFLVLLSPTSFAVDGVNIKETRAGIVGKYPTHILVFSAMYYFVKATTYGKWLLLLNSFLMLFYITILADARGLTLFFLASMGLYVLFNTSIVARVQMLLISVVLVGLAFLKQDVFRSLYVSYSQAMVSFVTGEGEDVSAKIRVVEIQNALGWLGDNIQHWLLGAGRLASSFNDGFRGVFGHFFISDIGIIGMIFCYGLIATLIYSAYNLFMLKLFTGKVGSKENQVIGNTFLYFCLFMFFTSLQTGGNTYFFVGLMSFLFGVGLFFNKKIIV